MDSLLRKYIDIIEEVADPVSGKTPEEAMALNITESFFTLQFDLVNKYSFTAPT